MKKKKSRKLLIILWMSVSFLAQLSPSRATTETHPFVGLQTFETFSRLVVSIDGSVSGRWKPSKAGFEIFLPGVELSDLGYSPQDVQKELSRLRSIRDPRVNRISLQQLSQGIMVKGRWKFPVGEHALANPIMDAFEFRDRSGPRWVIDFWVRPGMTLSEYRGRKQKEHFEAALKRMQEDEKVKASRQLAMAGAQAEIEDVERFCHQPLSEKDDYFLRFYPVHHSFDLAKYFPGTVPDSNYDYFIPSGKGREAQYVRLAQKLYQGGNFALAIRTIQFFEREFPKSEQQIEMHFLRANALVKLGHAEAAETALNRLIRDFPKSPVSLHAAMYVALKLYLKKSYSLAVEKFFWLVDHYSEHNLSWVFHLGAAESLYALGQPERALKEYRWLIDNAPSKEIGAEGAFRQGDLPLIKFQYEKALSLYYQNIQPFEIYGGKFPEYYLNRAETLYQLGQMDRAREEFMRFITRFPGHTEGWRATFRLAEIAGRNVQGSGPSSPEFRSNLYATINHYPSSPGATLARIRLAACGDHGDFDLETQEKFFSNDAKRFDGSGAVVMTDFSDFRALSHLRSLVSLKEPERTLELALGEFKSSRSPLVKRFLRNSAHDAFKRIILKMIEDGKSYEALSFYVAKSPTLPVPDQENDRSYLLALSEVASGLELGQLADNLFKEYQKQKTVRRNLAQAGPESKSALSEQDFARAKALWIKLKNSPEKQEVKEGEDLASIRKLLAQLDGDSKYAFEKEVMLALIAESQSEWSAAIQHVAQAQLIHNSPRIQSWLASLYLKADKKLIALNLFQALEERFQDPKAQQEDPDETLFKGLGVPLALNLKQVILEQIHIYEQGAKWFEAALAYSRMLEKGFRTNRALYGYARVLTKIGKPSDRKQIREVLEEVAKTSPNDSDEIFWKNLAVETLANQKIRETIQKPAKEGTI